MTRYSVQPNGRIFVKGYGFLSFARNMGKNVGKNISKNLIMLKSLQQICHLKLLQKERFKKQQK